MQNSLREAMASIVGRSNTLLGTGRPVSELELRPLIDLLGAVGAELQDAAVRRALSEFYDALEIEFATAMQRGDAELTNEESLRVRRVLHNLSLYTETLVNDT